jgi:hypothetical protein
MADETYDPKRVEQLVAMLRELAQRIARLDAEGRLLDEVPALLKQLGDVRTELFRYEVRTTFDTPDVAEHRRIVDEAEPGWSPDDEQDTDEEDGWPQGNH